MYADFIQFLLKVTEKDETESSILGEGKDESTETQVEEETITAVQEMDEASTSNRDAGTLQHRRRKASKVNDEIDRKILKSLEKIEPDENEAQPPGSAFLCWELKRNGYVVDIVTGYTVCSLGVPQTQKPTYALETSVNP